MIARNPSLWCALAGSMVLWACHDANGPDAALTIVQSQSVAAAKDKKAPNAPSSLRATEVTSSSVTLAWSASTDNMGVTSYLVRNNFGGEVTVAGTQTTAVFTGLTPLTTYTFYAYAVDAAGNRSPSSNFVSVKLPSEPAPNDPSDVTAPTTPANVRADLYNDGSRELQVTWIASTDNVTPQSSITYEVSVNGVVENTSVGVPQASVYGVAGDNVIRVVAIDANGNRSVAGVFTINIPF